MISKSYRPTELRKLGLNEKSVDWIERASVTLWDATHGIISKRTRDGLRQFVLGKCACEYAKSKQLAVDKRLNQRVKREKLSVDTSSLLA